VRDLRQTFWQEVRVPTHDHRLNPELEQAGRVADFLELAELMCLDALDRTESAGAHFREEFQTPEGEALRDDHQWCSTSAWATDEDGRHRRHLEPLTFDRVRLTTRDYR